VDAIGLVDLSLTAWCGYAPTLVRATAEVELYALVTHDMAGAQRAMEVAKAEREYLLRCCQQQILHLLLESFQMLILIVLLCLT
jgi:hypothetical protein